MAARDSKLNVNSVAEKVIIHEIPLSEHAKSSNTDCGVFQMINHISNDSDCGVFAILYSCLHMTYLDRWIRVDPNIQRFYTVHVLIQMRTYLYACLKAGLITLFPTAESTK